MQQLLNMNNPHDSEEDEEDEDNNNNAKKNEKEINLDKNGKSDKKIT